MNYIIISQVLSGIVVDEITREGVSYCAVEINNIGLYCDEKGFFQIKLKEGKYQLKISALGYEEYNKEIELKGNVQLKIYLKPVGVKLNEIVISAKRETFRKDFSINTIQDVQKYKTLPSPFEKDLMRVIQVQSGVVFANDFSGRFSVRGSAPFENLTILDGMFLYNPYHLGSFISIFDLDLLSSFQFLKGGYSAKYGNATGSIIDAKIREGSYKEYKNLVAISPITTKLLFEGPFSNYSSFVVSFRRTYIQEFAKIFNFDIPYSFFDIIGKFSYNFSEITNLSFSFINSQDNLRFSDIVSSNWGNRGIGINYKTFWSNYLLNSYLTYTQNFIDFGLFSKTFNIKNEFSILSMRLNFEYIASDWNISSGFDLAYITGYYRSNIFGIKIDRSGTPFISSLFLELKRDYKNFMLNIGTRLNYYKLSGYYFKEDFSIEPRTQLKYFLKEQLSIKSAIGLYNQYAIGFTNNNLQISSFYFWAPTFENVKPVKTPHIIFGIEGIPKFGNFEFVVFLKPYLNTVEINPERTDITNIDKELLKNGKALSYGFDIWFENKNLEISYTLSFSYDKLEGETLWHRTSFDKRHVFNFTLRTNLFNGEIGLKLTYASGSPYTDIISRYLVSSVFPDGSLEFPFWYEVYSPRNLLTLPSYKRVDIYYEGKYKSLNYGLGVINVFNFKNLFLSFYDYNKNPPLKREIYQIPFLPYFTIRANF
ncbi:MAG: TonB-dependent receptor [candidate division WOR-3 bacterium]